jgi:hypothetical protein
VTSWRMSGRGVPLGLLPVTLVYVGSVVLRLLLSADVQGPSLSDDEIAFLSNARVVAGVGAIPLEPTFVPTKYLGYSLFLVPLYWLGLSPAGLYSAALVVNALLASMVVFLSYWAARRIFAAERPRALAVAATAGLYPASLLNSSFAWSENLLLPLILAAAIAAFLLIERPTLARVATFGSLGGFLYFSHPRLLPTVLLCFLFLLAAALRRRVPAPLALVGAGTLALGVVLTRAVHDWLLPQMYGGSLRDTESNYAEKITGLITDGALLTDTFMNVAGTLWYLGIASVGISIIGAGVLGGKLWGGDASAAVKWTAAFALLSLGGGILISAISLAGAGDRIDYRFYGRYAEAHIYLILVAGLVALFGQGVSRIQRTQWLARAGVVICVLAVVTYFGHGPERFADHGTAGVTILGALGPSFYTTDGGGFPFWTATFVVLAAIVLIAATVLLAERALPLALCGLFLLSAAVAQSNFVNPLSSAIQSQAVLHHSSALQEEEAISYDVSKVSTFTLPLNQYYLRDTQFSFFDSTKGELPQHDVVIAGADWVDAKRLNARVIAHETHGDRMAWVLPGARADTLSALGRLFQDPINSPLPADALGFSLEPIWAPRALGGQILACSGGLLHLGTTVRHSGDGSPWRQATFGGAGPGGGHVYFVASWVTEDGRVAAGESFAGLLPHGLAPGEETDIRLAAPARLDADTPLPPGRYRVQVAPHQDMLGTFSVLGDDEPVEITVTVIDCD